MLFVKSPSVSYSSQLSVCRLSKERKVQLKFFLTNSFFLWGADKWQDTFVISSMSSGPFISLTVAAGFMFMTGTGRAVTPDHHGDGPMKTILPCNKVTIIPVCRRCKAGPPTATRVFICSFHLQPPPAWRHSVFVCLYGQLFYWTGCVESCVGNTLRCFRQTKPHWNDD